MGNCLTWFGGGNKNAAADASKHNDQREESGERPFDKFRQEAARHADKRGEYMRQSQEAWKRGDKGEAKRLSDLGKEEGAKVDAANRKARDAILNPQDLKAGTIDLHGLHVQEALDAVEDFLNMHHGNRDVVCIITGAGNHSANNYSKVKHETHALLKKKGLSFVETTHGSIDVTLKR